MEGPATFDHLGPAPASPGLPRSRGDCGGGGSDQPRSPAGSLPRHAGQYAGGVRGHATLLHKTPLPVVCTYQGAGVIPRDLLSCFAGRVGLSHNQPGDNLLDAADAIVTIGFNPIEYDPVLWNHGKKRTIIHIDSTLAEMDVDYWPTVELIGDTAATVTGLAGQLAPRPALNEIAELGAPAGRLR